MTIYIEYEGIEKPFKANTIQFGVGRGISMEAGTQEPREASYPSMSEISFSKKTDEATVELFRESFSKIPRKVKLKLVHEGTDFVYMIFSLEGSYISGFSFSAYENESPQENISLNYSKIRISHFSEDGTKSISSGYDLPNGQEIH